MVMFISSNYNSIVSILFSIYSTPFIACDFVWVGSNFALASGLTVADLFCNTWLKS